MLKEKKLLMGKVTLANTEPRTQYLHLLFTYVQNLVCEWAVCPLWWWGKRAMATAQIRGNDTTFTLPVRYCKYTLEGLHGSHRVHHTRICGCKVRGAVLPFQPKWKAGLPRAGGFQTSDFGVQSNCMITSHLVHILLNVVHACTETLWMSCKTNSTTVQSQVLLS